MQNFIVGEEWPQNYIVVEGGQTIFRPNPHKF